MIRADGPRRETFLGGGLGWFGFYMRIDRLPSHPPRVLLSVSLARDGTGEPAWGWETGPSVYFYEF